MFIIKQQFHLSYCHCVQFCPAQKGLLESGTFHPESLCLYREAVLHMITVAHFGDQKLNICIFLLRGKSPSAQKVLVK